MTNFNEMNWNELRKAAKENDIKCTNKADILKALNDLYSKPEISDKKESLDENSSEQIIEEIVIVPNTNKEVPAPVTQKTDDNTSKDSHVLPMNTFIKHKRNNKFFRIGSYIERGDKTIAVLVFKNKLSDKKTFKSEVQASWIKDNYVVVKAAYVKEEMTRREQLSKSRNINHPNDARLEVNISVKGGNRQWAVKDKVTNKVFKASEGKSVTNYIRIYKANIGGVSANVTETNDNTQYVCSCCGKPVNKNVVDFLGRNQMKLADKFRNKIFCYTCQSKLGISNALRKYNTPDGTHIINNDNVTDSLSGRPVV